ncbi:MAG: efflux RND transporter periplasmic adaptor subunit [Treponemataceae bacterium]
MRKFVVALIILAVAVAATFIFLIFKAAGPKTVVPTEAAGRRTIEEKVIASGSIMPERQVEVKSSLSGVVDYLFVEPGDSLKKGDSLLSIRVIPNSLELNSSQAALEKASIRLKAAASDLEKSKILADKSLIPDSEYRNVEKAYQLALEDYKEFRNRILLMKEGVSSDKQTINNLVLSPISGTVLDILVKEGTPVQESGGYSIGTTVAVIADMSSLLFEGEIDEGQIDKLRKGMEAKIKLAAVENRTIPGALSFLSPRGSESSGSIKFKIRITFVPPKDIFLRAGYSANAEILLNRAEKVVCVKERDVITENGRYYVEVENSPRQFVKTEVRLGVSDGLYTEILSGLKEGDRVKSRLGLNQGPRI